jgi:hypothetical protein
MKPYRPAFVVAPDGGVEQSFTANVIDIDETAVAFGDLIPDAARGLPYGTPVHSLLVHLGEDGRPELLEFNDQGNTVAVAAVERVELESNHVRFVFRADAGPYAGRVSLAPELEVFEDELPDPSTFPQYTRFDQVQLDALCVWFAGDEVQLASLREKLAAVP